MARPQKMKRVCKEPGFTNFVPSDVGGELDSSVILTVDEYETIRLIDLEGFSREECAKRMTVARTTVQAIYNSARHKIAQSLVMGMELRIAGGTFRLCDGSAGCPDCRKRETISDSFVDSEEYRL